MLEIDFALSIRVAGASDESLVVRIGGPFRLSTDHGTTFIDPENPSTVGPALVIANRPIDQMLVRADGTLLMRFQDGLSIEVSSDGPYETWQIAIDDGPILIGGPDGALSVFRPK